jgi:8-oxo-dGTP diphosphatase
MNERIEYVLGFIFDKTFDHVVLINKLRPDWQKGFLNGIGGKIDDYEYPIEAMKRECFEECGLEIDTWKNFAVIGGEGFNIWCYKVNLNIYENIIFNKTDEVVDIFKVKDLNNLNVISNLKWIIPMAIDRDCFANITYIPKN